MKKRYSGPQIVAKLRQADLLIGQGKSVPEVCKEIEVSQHFFNGLPLNLYKTIDVPNASIFELKFSNGNACFSSNVHT